MSVSTRGLMASMRKSETEDLDEDDEDDFFLPDLDMEAHAVHAKKFRKEENNSNMNTA